MNENKSKKYHIALYGLSSSGKTCLLAALAMPRISHPLGYSCVDMPTTGKKYEAGKEWLEKAINKIKNGKLPKPNSNDGGESFIFNYKFSANHQRFDLELEDYAGELIEFRKSSRF